MKLIRQLIEYLDGEDMLTDEMLRRLGALGWLGKSTFGGKMLSACQFPDEYPSESGDRYPYSGREEYDWAEPGQRETKIERGQKRKSIRNRIKNQKDKQHEMAQALQEMSTALERADIPSAPELEGLRCLAGHLGATTPWMKAIHNASSESLDAALLDAMKNNDPAANLLWTGLAYEVYRFPLYDTRWSSHKPLLRAYRKLVSSQAIFSPVSQPWGYTWIFSEKTISIVYEVVRAQQLVLESLGRIMKYSPENIGKWLARGTPDMGWDALCLVFQSNVYSKDPFWAEKNVEPKYKPPIDDAEYFFKIFSFALRMESTCFFNYLDAIESSEAPFMLHFGWEGLWTPHPSTWSSTLFDDTPKSTDEVHVKRIYHSMGEDDKSGLFPPIS